MVKQDVMRWAQSFSGCQPTPIFVFPDSNNKEVFDEEIF